MKRVMVAWVATLMVSLCSMAASAEIILNSMVQAGTGDYWVSPNIQLVNNSGQALDMSRHTLEYYLFEPDTDATDLEAVVWYNSMGTTSDIFVEVTRLPEALFSNEKGADTKISLSFAQGAIPSGGSLQLTFGVHTADWRSFDQEDDWSYMADTAFVANQNIVLKDSNGKVVAGSEPGGQSVPYGAEVNWIGEYGADELKDVFTQDGDAYRNADDGKAYVRYQDEWVVLDDSYTSGGQMLNDQSHLNMSGSNINNVGSVQTRSVQASGTVQATRFEGDGSGITNLRLEDGSVLFRHLNESTLLALKDYLANMGFGLPVVSVMADEASHRFVFRRNGNADGELLLSYASTSALGEVTLGTAVFPVGASQVIVAGAPGEQIDINSNVIVYQTDPMHATAMLAKTELSIEAIAGSDSLRLTRSQYTDYEFAYTLKLTHPDGSTDFYEFTWYDFQTGLSIEVGGPWGYGDVAELLPGNAYTVNSQQAKVEYPVVTLSIGAGYYEGYVRFTRDFVTEFEVEIEFLVTHPDGTSEAQHVTWQDFQTYLTLDVGGQSHYGDVVEILPSPYYHIDPNHRVYEIPKVTLGIGAGYYEGYVRFTRDFVTEFEVEIEFLVTHPDGTSEAQHVTWQDFQTYLTLDVGGQSHYGDVVEILPSPYYHIDPNHRVYEIPKVTLGIGASYYEGYVRFTRDFVTEFEVEIEFLVTHPDGTSEAQHVTWQDFQTYLTLDVGGQSQPGDSVEIIPSGYYHIDPDHASVLLPTP